jgi:hypothetical protein
VLPDKRRVWERMRVAREAGCCGRVVYKLEMRRNARGDEAEGAMWEGVWLPSGGLLQLNG